VLPDRQRDPQDSVGEPSAVKDIAGLAGKRFGRSHSPVVGERMTNHAAREESARASWKHLARAREYPVG